MMAAAQAGPSAIGMGKRGHRGTRTFRRKTRQMRATPSVDGILRLELDGGNDLLEPGQVVDGGRGVTRIELDPVAATSGGDDRQGATDLSGAAVDGDGLGRVAPLVRSRQLLGDPVLGRGITDRLRGKDQEQVRLKGRVVQDVDRGIKEVLGEGARPSRARSPLEGSSPRDTTPNTRAAAEVKVWVRGGADANSGRSWTVARTSSNQPDRRAWRGVVVRRKEPDPVAAASGCDDRHVAVGSRSVRWRRPRRSARSPCNLRRPPSARRPTRRAWNRRSAARQGQEQVTSGRVVQDVGIRDQGSWGDVPPSRARSPLERSIPRGRTRRYPCSCEVKVWVSGGGNGRRRRRCRSRRWRRLGRRGRAGGWLAGPPTFALGEPRTGTRRRGRTTTAAAPRPMGTSLLMLGTLHGPMTARCRFCSISARTAS